MSLVRALSLALLCLVSWPAHALLGLEMGCSVSTRPLQFGSYEATSAQPLKTSSSLNVRCLAGALVNVSFGPSETSGSIATRKMKHTSKADTLSYNIYSDSSYSRVWGTVASRQSVPVVLSLLLLGRDIPVFASIAPGQDVSGGQYHDGVTVYIEP
ncbi:putative secreted protein (plasmid) [Variovorax sp. PBL-H6]|nr:putative secreted protein [Variovorax sp. PBL-H6]VTU43617.1 putative secreted protein [Variovorax sp. SRS16]VTU43679.1 putative secreted protein [Variovorax sp. PBL-E5]